MPHRTTASPPDVHELSAMALARNAREWHRSANATGAFCTARASGVVTIRPLRGSFVMSPAGEVDENQNTLGENRFWNEEGNGWRNDSKVYGSGD